MPTEKALSILHVVRQLLKASDPRHISTCGLQLVFGHFFNDDRNHEVLNEAEQKTRGNIISIVTGMTHCNLGSASVRRCGEKCPEHNNMCLVLG